MQHAVMTTGGGQPTHQRQNNMAGPTSSMKGISAQKATNSNSNTASGKNMRSMSLSKRLQMANDIHQANATIDISNMYPQNQLGGPGSDLNNSAIIQQQYNTLMTNNQIINRAGVQNKFDKQKETLIKGRQAAQSQPKTTTNRRSKHAKNFSMVQNSQRTGVNQHAAALQQIYQQNTTMPFSGRNQTDQYLNQHPVNQTMLSGQMPMNLNNTQQVPMVLMSDTQTPVDYQTVGGFEQFGGSAFNFAQLMSPKDHLMAGNVGHIRYQSNSGMPQPQYSSYSFLQGGPGFVNQVGSQNQLISNASGLNQTGRSFSHCSAGGNFQTVSGKALNKANVAAVANIPESQMLESEEHFESGKVFLAEQKYKEALKMFSKSLSVNKMNYDALFYRAVSNLDSGNPAKAITDLTDLVEKCPDYRKTMFIVLSIAYRRVNDYTGALRTLSKALLKYNRYIEAYIARGQIYIFQKKWEKALSDFRAVISLQVQNGLGYLGQGDSLKGIGNYNGALLSFSKAIEVDSKTVSQGLMKRGLLFLQMKYSEQALQDFTKLTEIAEESNQPPTALSKAYFYKAKALKKMNNLNDAILYFEQVIRANDDNHLASSALYEIAKIKIQQKDFYEAYYNLKRANHFKLKQKKLVNYKMFTEGVIFLMKRKTKTGLKLITQLIDRLKAVEEKQEGEKSSGKIGPDTSPDYIYNLIFLYRAYGYFVIEEYDNSLKDYIKANQIKKLNLNSLYNMSLCQGLKCIDTKEYENAISFFTKASQKIQGNRDPYLLRAIAIVRYALHKPIKPKTKTKMLKDAKRDLNRALQNSHKDYAVLYLRGLINFALHFFYDAITDLETVIEKSEEANAKHYLARGRCYACLSMFKEAITDLSIAINLNKDLLDAYLNRGKCAYLIGDTGLAFMDFQKLIVIEPKNPMVHIYAGNLLMTTGSYEDATKAFTNADNIHKSSLALYQRGRCNVALNLMTEALKDLNKVLEAAPTDKVAIADRECLNSLKEASGGATMAPKVEQKEGQPLNQLSGPIAPHDKMKYNKSVVALTKLISYENNEHLAKITHDSSIQHHHSQMIPSAQRTKTDKIRAIRRRKEQDRLVNNGKSKRNDLRFRVQQQESQDEQDEFEDISDLDPDEIMKLNRQLEAGSEASQGADQSDDAADQKEAEDANYYKENIFNKEDYYLYRGVMQIYAGEYEKALSDLDQSSGIMHVNKVLQEKNQFPDGESLNEDGNDNASNASSQTDLSDVGLCSLNIHEFSFNLVICFVCLKQYEKALEKLDYMFNTIPKKYAGQLWLIRGQINKILRNQSAAKKDFRRAEKQDNENYVKFVQQKQSVYLSVFPQQQRLCNSFAFIETPLTNETANINLRPSFSFPFIKPPNMIPCVDNQVLDGLNCKAVPLKPEAPWIKKCSFGIKFTDEIYMTDDDRENTPDEDKEYKKKKQRQQERAMEGNIMMPRSISEPIILQNNIFFDDKKKTLEDGEEVMEAHQMVNIQDDKMIDQEEAAELMQIMQQKQNGLLNDADDFDEVQRANQIAKGDTLDESGDEKSGEYEQDFDQRYREKSKQYERMDEIHQLKKPIKALRQLEPKIDYEQMIREQIDEFFEECNTNAQGHMPIEEGKMCILSWAEQILGYEPQDDLVIKIFNRMKQEYMSKEEMMTYMMQLQQQAGATGLLSRSEAEFHEEHVQKKAPRQNAKKEAKGQMSDEEYSYAMEEDFSVGGSEVDQNVADPQKSYQMTSGEFDSSDKQGFADIKASLRQGTTKKQN